MSSHSKRAFAIWLTGLPASGKSTIARAVRDSLEARGVTAAVLESDALRKILTPNPAYTDEERHRFYQQMADLGAMLVENGVSVIFDATAHRRAYRDRARSRIPKFAEIYVDCPLETCMKRDPKGIYQRGQRTSSGTVPGLHAAYEPPVHPEVTIPEPESPEDAAQHILSRLVELGFV